MIHTGACWTKGKFIAKMEFYSERTNIYFEGKQVHIKGSQCDFSKLHHTWPTELV